MCAAPTCISQTFIKIEDGCLDTAAISNFSSQILAVIRASEIYLWYAFMQKVVADIGQLLILPFSVLAGDVHAGPLWEARSWSDMHGDGLQVHNGAI